MRRIFQKLILSLWADQLNLKPPPFTEAVWAEVNFFMVVLCFGLVAYSVVGFSAAPVGNRFGLCW